MSNARCTDCRYFPHARYCTLADKHIKDARRVRYCEAFATGRTGPFQDGLRVVFDLREILAASVIDGQFDVLVGALAVGLPALISTEFRVYVVLNGRLTLLDAEESFRMDAPLRGPGGQSRREAGRHGLDVAVAVTVRKKPICGARTRAGGACRCKPLPGKKRCKYHGGLSSGPRTESGREQSRRNLEKAREALAGPLHAEARRERALKGWKSRRRREKRQRMIRTARQVGCSTAEIAALMRVL